MSTSSKNGKLSCWRGEKQLLQMLRSAERRDPADKSPSKTTPISSSRRRIAKNQFLLALFALSTQLRSRLLFPLFPKILFRRSPHIWTLLEVSSLVLFPLLNFLKTLRSLAHSKNSKQPFENYGQRERGRAEGTRQLQLMPAKRTFVFQTCNIDSIQTSSQAI